MPTASPRYLPFLPCISHSCRWLSPGSRSKFGAAIAGYEFGQCGDAGEVFVDRHMLLRGVANADVAGGEIDGRNAPRGEERGLRPEWRAPDAAPLGTDARDGP